MSTKRKIAVIGAGVSGLTVARVLNGTNAVTLFERNACVGGNAHAVQLPVSGTIAPVDAGVVMFHTVGYPNFLRLLSILGVPTSKSEMSVEILTTDDDARYGFNLNRPVLSLLSQLHRPLQNQIFRDCVRFFVHAKSRSKLDLTSLGEHLASHKYSRQFRILLSFFCGATWTINHKNTLDLPMCFLREVFESLGFFPTLRRGHWRHVPGSVLRYLNELVKPLIDSTLLGTEVNSVERLRQGGVEVCYGNESRHFDEVVFAIPPEAALRCISNPTDLEIAILKNFRSTHYDFVFSNDPKIASWTKSRPSIFACTDVINSKQESEREYLFKVGFTDIARMTCVDTPPFYMWYPIPGEPLPDNVVAKFPYSTPIFNAEVVQSQRRHAEISGKDRLHFCGSAWTNGIHEGGVVSALNVTRSFGKGLKDIETI